MNTAYPTEEGLESEYTDLVGIAKTIPNLIAEEVFNGKFTMSPELRTGTSDYIYDADAADQVVGYNRALHGRYVGNDSGVNLILTDAITQRPNVVGQLDNLIDGDEGLDCG